MRKLVASIGDVNPLQYGGALIFKVSGPHKGIAAYELDVLSETKGEGEDIERHTIPLEDFDPEDWYADNLESVANYTGISVDELLEAGKSADPVQRAWFYKALADYHGIINFDEYPVKFTQSEAKRKYRAMFQRARNRGITVYA
jgi:hypothetical protein